MLQSPPYNIDIEQQVLANLIENQDLLTVTQLDSDCFFGKENKQFFKLIKRLKKEGKTIDYLTLKDYEVSDESLADFMSGFFVDTDFYKHEAILFEYKNRRILHREFQKLSVMCYNVSTDYTKIIQEAGDAITSKILSEKPNNIEQGLSETLIEVYEEKESPFISDTTGFRDLDAVIGGRRRGALYTIGATTGQGKSTFMLNLCLKALDNNIQCAIFSTEMPAKEIHIRAAANIAKVESRKIERASPDIVEQVTDVVGKKRDAKCNIYDTFGTASELERLVILEAIRGTEVIFVDYLQQVRLSNKINRNLAIGDLTTSLKQIAIKYGISVICLSQLNRSGDRTQEPSLKLLRDSGSIEQDSDVVIFLHGYDDHERTAGVYIKKNRHGELASFHLPYIKKYFYMYNKY